MTIEPAIEMPEMPPPPKQTIAAAVVALIVKKGGDLRLSKRELAEMEDYVVTVTHSLHNPDVVHIGVITRAEMQERIIKEVIERSLQGAQNEKPADPKCD